MAVVKFSWIVAIHVKLILVSISIKIFITKLKKKKIAERKLAGMTYMLFFFKKNLKIPAQPENMFY